MGPDREIAELPELVGGEYFDLLILHLGRKEERTAMLVLIPVGMQETKNYQTGLVAQLCGSPQGGFDPLQDLRGNRLRDQELATTP